MLCRRFAAVWLVTVFACLIASDTFAQRPDRRGRGRDRAPDKLKVGGSATDFALKSPDGKQTVQLSSFRGKRPVALVFGSYT
jgi:hypothetical protein